LIRRLDAADNSFDFCAECLHLFIRDKLGRDENADHLPLGFTVGLLR
jgi:hypothetical protein